MKTNAVIFTKENEFKTQELTLDNPGDADIVVRTLVSAISPGTERWILRGKHVGTKFPCCPGYHRIGIIEKCGKNVDGFEEGDVVYGSGNRWQEKEIISMWGAHVGMSVSTPAGYNFLSPTQPSRLALETMSFAIVAGVANRGIRFCDIRHGQKILIIGAGIIGVCAAQLARLRGAQPVLLEMDNKRADFVKPIAGDVFNPQDENLGEKLQKAAPAGFDIMYDTVGHADTTNNMLQHMARHGLILLQAQYFDKTKCALDLDQIKIKELTIKTTCGIDSQDFYDTIQNIQTRQLKIAPLITHRLPSERILEGYHLLHTSSEFNLGIVFHWQ